MWARKLSFLLIFILLLLSAGLLPGWPSWAFLSPREGNFFLGVLFFPILHQNYQHLIGNVSFLIPCALFVFKLEPYDYWKTFLVIYIGHGVLLWFIGRDGAHLGCSGFALGLGFYILASAVISLDWTLLIGALIIFFIYYSVYSNFMITGEGIGDDAHISGVIVGCLTAVYQKYYSHKTV